MSGREPERLRAVVRLADAVACGDEPDIVDAALGALQDGAPALAVALVTWVPGGSPSLVGRGFTAAEEEALLRVALHGTDDAVAHGRDGELTLTDVVEVPIEREGVRYGAVLFRPTPPASVDDDQERFLARLTRQLAFWHHTREALAQSETARRGLTNVLEQLPFGVVVRCLRDSTSVTNSQAVALLGDASTSSGPSDDLRVHFPDGQPCPDALWPMSRALRGEAVKEENFVLRRDHAEPRVLRTSAVPLFDHGERVGAALIVNDVTRAWTLEEERDRDRRLLEVVLDQLPVGVMIVDARSRRLLLASRRFEEIVQRPVTPGMPLAKYLDWLIFDENGAPLPRMQWPLTRALRGERVEGKRLIVGRADGSLAQVEVWAAPVLDDDGRLIAAVGTTADVGERVAYEQERERTARFREQLLGVVGHDLRSPLTAIRLCATAVATRPIDPFTERAVSTILSSATRAERLIAQLLDFTRVRLGGGLLLVRQPLDLVALVDDVVEELLVTHRGREVHVTGAQEAGGEWDGDRIHQVVSNLVGNALRHGPSDQGVTVSIAALEHDVFLSVHNGGEPIPEELRERLFDPFSQGGRPPNRREGAGLGLYIVREIVRAHDGVVEVSSNAEDGTTFLVRLPRRPVAPAEEEAASASEDHAAG